MKTVEAIDIVKQVANRAGYHWIKILKVVPPNGEMTWKIEIDVGLNSEIKKTVELDKDGELISFS